MGTLATTETRTNWHRKVRELILDSDSGYQGVKEYTFRAQGSQWVGLQGPRGSRGRLTGCKGVKGVGINAPRGSNGRPAGSQGLKG